MRAVCGSPNAGTRADEPFAIDPYSEAVFQHFLRGPRSASLPRKFKISFAASDLDPLGQVNIQDIGITAVVVDGKEGFRVVAAGGLGSSPQAPLKLYDCLAKEDLIPVCEALVRVHHSYGDRQNRAKARLKFVLRQHGDAGFRKLFEEKLAEVRAEGITGKALPDRLPAANPTPIPAVAGDEGAWRKANVRAHREAGLAVVSINVPRGDVPAASMRTLADLSEWFSEGDARTTNDQNLVFRRVRHEHLPRLYSELVKLGYHRPAHGLVDVTSCPGASTCMLGLTLSKNLAKELEDGLAKINADPSVFAAHINISGCPNSCGQHHIGNIGLHGASSKIGDKIIPHYMLLLGGGDEGATIHHAALIARIPARKVSTVITTLALWYGQEKQAGETFVVYLRRIAGFGLDRAGSSAARNRLKERLAPLFAVAEGQLTEADLTDIGTDKLFSVAMGELGVGECMA